MVQGDLEAALKDFLAASLHNSLDLGKNIERRNVMQDFNPQLDLKIERKVDISPEKIWTAWTKPEHLKPWFCPKPWEVPECRIDLKAGGEFFTKMKGPGGEEFASAGCYLEIIPNQKLVWTSALAPGFRPQSSDLPFTGIILLEKDGSETKYTAIARHGDEETKKKHEEMGFEQGWSICLDQLVVYTKENL
jgi:uncharacterized protein YndB with AHSA1/START domain